MLQRCWIAGLICFACSPATAQEVADEEAQADIVVTGRVENLYRADEVQVGKLPGDPLTSPLVVTTLTEQLIRDQGARDAQDIYRNISGVSAFSYAGVTARGFRQEEIFYDGLRGDPYAGFSVPQLFNVQQLEFLKGPAGMLYGPGAPGGLFNYVTKQPSRTGFAEVRVVGGNFNRFGGQAEATGAISETLSVRGGAFYENRDLPRWNADNETLIVDGSVAMDLPGARIIVQGTRYEQNLGGNRLRGVPVDNDGNFLADRQWNHNEASDFLDLKSAVAQVRGEFQPTRNLKLDIGFRYNDAREVQNYHEPRLLVDTDGNGVIDLITREFRDQLRTQETYSVGGNLVWSANLGSIANRVLAGFDYFTADTVFGGRALRGAATPRPGLPGPLTLNNPVYGQTDPKNYALPAYAQTVGSGYRRGVYLLDEVTIGRVILTGGIRQDKFEDDSDGTSFADDSISYRGGAVWRVREDISLFGQYATSFEPQGIGSQDVRAGGPFGPTTGDIIEGGVKTALMNGRVQSSLSAYRIKRQNILQPDPRGDVAGDGIDDFVSFGEVVSKGVELDIAADITPNWLATIAYAYNDTRITRTNGSAGFVNNVGDRFANAPEHQLGFWTRYQLPAPGLAFAFGGDYVSERISLSNQRIQPYFVFDGSVTLARGPVNLMLRVDNIFDKTYAVSGFNDRGGHFPGEPRSFFLEAGYRL
ncbi:TonB-dependent siderophore receptor [Sphingomonas sp. 37zxx]|uniref:TonB-dependent siderophore receptor n=1 Tax=Sphingomonas sp. 37zxx TaxID=1550073 RepID=UPI00068A87F4|nr:TonB-dependent receptor [Sphingomonas sp. 37zxx]